MLNRYLFCVIWAASFAAQARFSPQDIANKTFVKIKHSEWGACRRNQNPFYSLELGANSLYKFLDQSEPLNDLAEMESLQLQKGKAEQAPWSGDYWSYAGGVLGARYTDEEFNFLFTWPEKFDYIKKHSAQDLLRQQGSGRIENLSPAEKYDLLVGDPRMALTRSMWLEGKKYYDETGKVENWMGICHGWAPAAIMEPRPTRAIEVASLDHRFSVVLPPAEIKGLVSYSWANNYYPSAFLGQRCNKKDPIRDANGRLMDPECFDLNPATWHMAVVSRLGQQRQSFVMDATYDYEVWNQPVLDYSYEYFNVQTQKRVYNLANATVRREEFYADKFAKYRSPKVKYIVGIEMQVSYVMEAEATNEPEDSEDNDIVRSTTYRYDLELSEDGKIIGGEWYSTVHPDFIWTPLKNAEPRAPYDSHLQSSDWSGQGSIPQEWARRAREGSAHGIILNTLTKALLLRAAQ